MKEQTGSLAHRPRAPENTAVPPRWRAVLLIVKTNRLLHIRTVSPDFRITRSVCLILTTAAATLALALGFILTLLVAVGPRLIEFLDTSQTLTAMLYGSGIIFLAHHIFSISGRTARETRAPADAAILTHAGYTQGEIIVARIILPIALETLAMVTVIALGSILALYSWQLSPGTLVAPALLSISLAVAGALVRAALLCILAMGGVSLTLLRLGCWTLVAAVAGAAFSGLLLPAFPGRQELQPTLHRALNFIASPEGTHTLLGILTTLLLATAITLPKLLKFPRSQAPIDSPPVHTRRALPLPRNAWGRLIALPLTTLRDRPDSETGEILISVRAALCTAAFGLGALWTASAAPVLPTEAAWGIAASGPLLAAGLTHGICSVNTYQSLLPHLTASHLGERGVASALICSTFLLCALLGAAPLPMIIFSSTLPVGSALSAWLTGALLVSPATVFADCLFPARIPANSNGRIRQHPVATLLSTGLTLSICAAIYAGLHIGIPIFIMIIGAASLAPICTLTAHFPRGAL